MNRLVLNRLTLNSLALTLAGALWAAPGLPTLAGTPVDTLRQEYAAEGAGPFSAAGGETLWRQVRDDRSCADCHTADPRNPGKHVKTGKAIEPLAPSVNPERLTDEKDMRKWLRRNCQWTLGRLCTPQEKGDFLTWLEQQ